MPSSKMAGKASASAPGTCGELAQGLLDGTLCMVTCPIDMRSAATVELFPGSGRVRGPVDSPKATKAVHETLRLLDELTLDAYLRLDSGIPRGKGMASSTADVSAAIAATATAAGRTLRATQIAEIALKIEPTDGVMLPGIAIFDHRKGRIATSLGEAPPMRVLVLDFGGVVDTLEFNKRDRMSALHRLEPKMAEAVSLIRDGISRKDPSLIGKGATVSSTANQEILFNPYFEAVLEISKHTGALGVNVAHSGTVIGMLFPDDAGLANEAELFARRHLSDLESARQCHVTSGGVRGF